VHHTKSTKAPQSHTGGEPREVALAEALDWYAWAFQAATDDNPRPVRALADNELDKALATIRKLGGTVGQVLAMQRGAA